jgi:two-component system sensor histidine kinase RegB
MSYSIPGLFQADPSNSWVRLRTLIVLRWIAIAGQLIAILIAQRYFGLTLDLGLCSAAIGVSVIANLISIFVYPENKRLSEREAVMMLLFDTAQLGFLLYVTGGMHNPFAILIVAPVTVAATALSLRSTVIVGFAALLEVSVVAQFHLPLTTQTGAILRMPEVFVFGFWLAVVTTVIFLGLYARRISTEIHSMSRALLAAQMALAREQKLTDLGGVVAAAAHELGTPLATIKLVSAELMEELSDQPELREDAGLIRDQADRCRDILRSMGKAGKDDLHLHQAPLNAVVEEAAEPHRGRGIDIHIGLRGIDLDLQDLPVIQRRPEIVHGLRNLIQNAVDFASRNVWIEMCWTADNMRVRIIDDGRGYSPDIIGRIGDPFIRRRSSAPDKSERPEYEGMGLGLFIAKTLLERTGAELSFANGSEPYTGTAQPGHKSGAIAQVVWQRGPGGVEALEKKPVLGRNLPISA